MKRTIWEPSMRDASRAFSFHFSPIPPILESFCKYKARSPFLVVGLAVVVKLAL